LTAVLLNIDAGELPDEPEELTAIADLVHVACGGHAGDAASMERVLRACKAHATLPGAHPSYEDREGFGRRELEVPAEEIARSVARQCRALAVLAQAQGLEVLHVKPHGALYHAANRDRALAAAVAHGAQAGLTVKASRITLVGPPQGELRAAASAAGMLFLREGFADRAMRPDGTLVPRTEPGAVLTDPAAARAQARRLARAGDFDTLCVHGDTAGAVDIARAVRDELS
jgi:UPF0271 protein